MAVLRDKNEENLDGVQLLSSAVYLGAIYCIVLGIKFKWFRARLNFSDTEKTSSVQPKLAVYRSLMPEEPTYNYTKNSDDGNSHLLNDTKLIKGRDEDFGFVNNGFIETNKPENTNIINNVGVHKEQRQKLLKNPLSATNKKDDDKSTECCIDPEHKKKHSRKKDKDKSIEKINTKSLPLKKEKKMKEEKKKKEDGEKMVKEKKMKEKKKEEDGEKEKKMKEEKKKKEDGEKMVKEKKMKEKKKKEDGEKEKKIKEEKKKKEDGEKEKKRKNPMASTILVENTESIIRENPTETTNDVDNDFSSSWDMVQAYRQNLAESRTPMMQNKSRNTWNKSEVANEYSDNSGDISFGNTKTFQINKLNRINDSLSLESDKESDTEA